MHVGEQFHVPEGAGSLRKGVRYYVARPREHDILIAWFERKSTGWRVHCMWVGRDLLMHAMKEDPPTALRCEPQLTVPPWLEKECGLNYDELEEYRSWARKETYRVQATRRLIEISPALDAENEILSSDNPLSEIVRQCAKAGSKTHPHRLQVWFFAYVLHGHDLWSLKRPAGGVGLWNRREEPHRSKKLGRPSLSGRSYGWPSALMREDIISAYKRYGGLGVYMQRIHAIALERVFKCTVTKDASGQSVITQPQNRPFPSYGQFRYVVTQHYGLEAVQRALYGNARIRRCAVSDEGAYSGQYANLLESFEIDAYVVEDRPKSYLDGQTMPALYVVRGKCPHSKAIVGVGASLGSENKQAYRSMLLCASLPKSVIARLYGMGETIDDWEMVGLPPQIVSDRGPAGSDKLIRRSEDQPVIKTETPSYDGQSKPFVESGNPRSVKVEGAPSYVQSDLTVAQMVKREILEAVRMNEATSISDRLSNEEVIEFRKRGWSATPNNLWKLRTEQLRSSAHCLSVEQAVRRFAEPCEVEVDKRGVKFRKNWYSSKIFRDTKVMGQLVDGGALNLRAYIVPISARIIWVEVKGVLIELEPIRISRVDMDEFEVSLFEQDLYVEERRRLDSDTRIASEAASLRARTDFVEVTGKNWSDGERRSGKPKRPTGTVAAEVEIIRRDRASKNNKRA